MYIPRIRFKMRSRCMPYLTIRTLARSNFFHLFNVKSSEIEYTLSSCAGTFVSSGKISKYFVVESCDGSSQLELPSILECNEIPNVRDDFR